MPPCDAGLMMTPTSTTFLCYASEYPMLMLLSCSCTVDTRFFFCYSSDVRTRTRETVKQNNKKKSFSRTQHSHTTTDTAGGFQSTLVVAGTTRPTPPPADRPQRPPQCRRFPSLIQLFFLYDFFCKAWFCF